MTDGETLTFEIRNLGTDGSHLVPKDFPKDMQRCFNRKEHVDTLQQRIEDAADDVNKPGVYMSGPAGAGKSILAYIIAQKFKFEKGWLTIYIPDCRAWAKLTPSKAKGFFLDRVLDALSTQEMQTNFTDIYERLTNPPKLQYEPNVGTVWTAVGGVVDSDISSVYDLVLNALNSSTVNVLFICDEINALWGDPPRHGEDPWSLTQFYPKFLTQGALLLTGTTDNDFVGKIPNSLERHVYPVGKCSNDEIITLKNLDENAILRDIEELDTGEWQSIFDHSGNIPREFRQYVESCKTSGLDKRVRDFMKDKDSDAPALKKRKTEILQEVNDSIKVWRANNSRHHTDMLDLVLRSDTGDCFKNALFQACESIFLTGKPATKRNEVLRVPNFVVTATGKMYPTTTDAQKVYFDWFCKEAAERGENRASAVTTLLERFLRAENGGDRGNVFEDYLAAKLTVLGRGPDPKFVFHSLHNGGTTHHELDLVVSERIYTSADNPPRNFQHFADNTLLTHRGLNGGEARVDVIHYRKDRVIYIEATVGNYRDTKIPTEEDPKGRQKLILDTLQKWLGKDVFEVEVDTIPSHGQDLASAPKELVVSYRGNSNRVRPDVPKIYYIVATTCPNRLHPQAARVNKFNWIKVCGLEDLFSAKILPEDKEKEILEKQATKAK